MTTIAGERLARQGIGARATTVEQVVRGITAVQAQLWSGAQLAVRARAREVTPALIERSIATGSLVSWLNRGTLHLVHRDDFWLLQYATAPARLATLRSRFRANGLPEARLADIGGRLEEVLHDGELHSKAELQPLMGLDSLDISPNRRTILAASVLEQLSATGTLVRGPTRAGQVQYVSAATWVGRPPTPAPRPDALAALALRYSSTHWPATADDFAAWLGIGRTEARSAWAAAAVDTRHIESVPATLWSGLLGPFDPTLHGWPDRTWLLGEYINRVISTNGVFRPSIIVANRCVGLWKLERGRVTLDFFEPQPAAVGAQLRAEADAIESFMGSVTTA